MCRIILKLFFVANDQFIKSSIIQGITLNLMKLLTAFFHL